MRWLRAVRGGQRGRVPGGARGRRGCGPGAGRCRPGRAAAALRMRRTAAGREVVHAYRGRRCPALRKRYHRVAAGGAPLGGAGGFSVVVRVSLPWRPGTPRRGAGGTPRSCWGPGTAGAPAWHPPVRPNAGPGLARHPLVQPKARPGPVSPLVRPNPEPGPIPSPRCGPTRGPGSW